MNFAGPRLTIKYEVRIPPGLNVLLKTQNGEVRLENVQAIRIAASTTNGGINGRGLSGAIDATTVNGGIQMDLDAVTGETRMTTVNGGVRLSVAPGVNADLEATVVNGGISIEDGFPLSGDERSRQRVAGRIGSGGPRLVVQTTNGGVRVNSRGAPGVVKSVANEDKSARYHRLRRRTSLLDAIAQTVFLLALVLSGASTAIRTSVESIVGTQLVPVAITYVFAIATLSELLHLPFAFYHGVVLERRYGLSTESTGRWLTDHLKAAAIVLGVLMTAGVIVASLLQSSPAYWWLLASIVFAAALVLLARFAPVVLFPLFYEVRPLEREELRARLLALAERAGTPVSTPSSGASVIARRKPTRRSWASAVRDASSSPTRCWLGTLTTRSRQYSHTNSRTTFTEISGRRWRSRPRSSRSAVT